MEKQTISSFQFPPGVRFHPSDEELIVYYLLNKVNSLPLPAAVIGEVELYNYNPWDLPKKAPFGDDEWFFFSPRDRKYPNGARPNRTAASGYWKATGTDKPILGSSGERIGVKKSLVFYIGKPPNGVKTDWIMIEYRIPDTLIRSQRSKGSMRLDDWVLCRIRQKGNMSKNAWEVPRSPSKLVGDMPNMKEQLPSVNIKDSTSDMSSYFLPEDCHLLAKLLANQALTPTSTVTRTTSQSSSSSTVKDCNGAYVHGLTTDNQVINSYFDSSFNFLGKPNDENGFGALSQSMKVTTPQLNENDSIVLSNNMLATKGSRFFNQDESQGDEFKHNLSNAIMNLQELDMTTFAEKILQ